MIASEEKQRIFIFFSAQETGGSPTGTSPENRVCYQIIGSGGIPVSSGFQVPDKSGHFHARTIHP